ncbi:sensor histidine kinase [Aurantiacibacter suaedae]|uniref:sensor histidine kinase n=1 Tax=Aurantiacibacter suaedae TaxID=2545755 RepID=UPI0013871405|nr:histidine kinase [Aurantiacibacter suaedae]
MTDPLPVLTAEIETVGELRELYRAAEARAARLRLLSNVGGDLIEADSVTLDEVVRRSLARLAFFVGGRGADLLPADGATGIAIKAPGREGGVLCRVQIEGLASLDAIADEEDREACRMLLDLVGTAVERVERERDREHLLAILQERETQLETLVARMFSAQEDERRRVAYELHDGVAQTATALLRLLEGATAQAKSEAFLAQREQLTQIARGLVTELRGVIAGLRPTILDDLGFSAALEALCDDLERDGYRVTKRLRASEDRLPNVIETTLYRVAQEAITNIRKHAGQPCPVLVEADLRQGAEHPFCG